MARLQGKLALVTGAASGLGLAIAQRFILEGAKVVMSDINADMGRAAASSLGAAATFVEHDVANESSWLQVMAEVAKQGRLNILVNNAGILMPGSIEEATLAQWQRLMHVNADSAFLGCQQGVAAMKEQGGAIVNIASVSSWMGMADYPAYSASKAAVAALTRSVALHCRKQGLGIRVNSVHPDGIYTPMMQNSAPGVPAKYLLFDKKHNKAGRACTPDKVANMVLFLASDEAEHISGAEMRVDNAILGFGL